MFGDYLVWDETSENNATEIFENLPHDIMVGKFIISIGGISGTRKSETAHRLADKLIKYGKQCHIISGDDYYTTLWHERNAERKKGVCPIGPEEWDWTRLKWTMETFRNSKYSQIQFFQMSKFTTGVMQCSLDKACCDILIFEGLYGCHLDIPANFRVHLGPCTPTSTFEFRCKRNKENENNRFRKSVVDRECKAVKLLKRNADLIIT